MINRVVLVGRITKELKLAQGNNKSYCKFTLAVNRTFTNTQGERTADFIPCVVFDKQAENLVNCMSKGSLIGVEGRLQVSSFEGQDGKRIWTTDVVCDSVQFLESKKDGQQQQQQSQPQFQNQQQYGQQQAAPQYSQPSYNQNQEHFGGYAQQQQPNQNYGFNGNNGPSQQYSLQPQQPAYVGEGNGYGNENDGLPF